MLVYFTKLRKFYNFHKNPSPYFFPVGSRIIKQCEQLSANDTLLILKFAPEDQKWKIVICLNRILGTNEKM